jgi:6-pyruvoyltetrahydropterin/6-carboxytetrahydropterin synthase
MIELSKQFLFDAAHTLERELQTESSRRIHGHSYRAVVTLRGQPDPQSGMLIDLGMVEQVLEKARRELDHHFLNEVAGLGPATMENLCVWIWQKLAGQLPLLCKVAVFRDSGGEACIYYEPDAAP